MLTQELGLCILTAILFVLLELAVHDIVTTLGERQTALGERTVKLVILTAACELIQLLLLL